MTAKSKKKGNNRGAPKKMSKGTLNASAETISQGALDASAETVGQGTSGTSAEMIPSGCANAGELNEEVVAESTKLNAQGKMILQNILQEWFEFSGMRMRQHVHLSQTVQGCRSLPDLQQAYSQFWQNAFTQYGEETRRMLLITQGAVDDVSHTALENGAPKATLH
jgi:hypothetical protein